MKQSAMLAAFVVIVLVFACPAHSSLSSGQKVLLQKKIKHAEKYYTHGNQNFGQKFLSDARKEAEAALDKDPDDAYAMFLLAQCVFYHDKYQVKMYESRAEESRSHRLFRNAHSLSPALADKIYNFYMAEAEKYDVHKWHSQLTASLNMQAHALSYRPGKKSEAASRWLELGKEALKSDLHRGRLYFERLIRLKPAYRDLVAEAYYEQGLRAGPASRKCIFWNWSLDISNFCKKRIIARSVEFIEQLDNKQKALKFVKPFPGPIKNKIWISSNYF